MLTTNMLTELGLEGGLRSLFFFCEMLLKPASVLAKSQDRSLKNSFGTKQGFPKSHWIISSIWLHSFHQNSIKNHEKTTPRHMGGSFCTRQRHRDVEQVPWAVAGAKDVAAAGPVTLQGPGTLWWQVQWRCSAPQLPKTPKVAGPKHYYRL